MSLYPGERYPVLIETDRVDAFREGFAVERRPLPGVRARLEIQASGRRLPAAAGTPLAVPGAGPRMVQVQGEVRNASPAVVRRLRLWVLLRDRNGRLTGFRQVRNLPVLAPEERVPFELKIEQLGGDFASVSTLYQTE
ncbi:MAG: FxLYD domain-containing protein [Luteibacter sp.]